MDTPEDFSGRDEATLVCHRCGALLRPGEGSLYVVRIEAFADPTPARLDAEETLPVLAAEFDALVEQMRDLTEQELMDQVYRRLTLHLCGRCYRHWIENPAGAA
ncbi:MAG: hypothetical protein ACYTGG_06720 [Planctomycetota bacterium]|jgi:hypothetical protein